MNRRLAATFLWFLVGWTAGSMATYFLAMPEGVNLAAAAVLAAIVWWDPAHLFWPAGRRVLREIPERKSAPAARLAPK